MARARNIKPKFFQNEELAEVSPLGRLLFIGLWTICDFRGCLEYRPKRIRAQILPYDECNTEELLISLEKSGFIQTYSVQGQRYIKITTFERHQTPHKNERDAGSDIPDISKKDKEIKELEEFQSNPEKDGTTPASSLFLNPSSGTPLPESVSENPGKAVVEQKLDRAPKEDPAATIFAYWQKTMQSPRSAFDKARRSLIEKALKDYTPREVCEAIRGCAMTPHNMGINDRNEKYNGLNVILKNADNIDRFIRTAHAKPNGHAVGVDQSDAERLADVEAALARMNGDTLGGDPYTIDMEQHNAQQ